MLHHNRANVRLNRTFACLVNIRTGLEVWSSFDDLNGNFIAVATLLTKITPEMQLYTLGPLLC